MTFQKTPCMKMAGGFLSIWFIPPKIKWAEVAQLLHIRKMMCSFAGKML